MDTTDGPFLQSKSKLTCKVILIKVKVSKHYKKRTTDQNEAKFKLNIIEEGQKRMA